MLKARKQNKQLAETNTEDGDNETKSLQEQLNLCLLLDPLPLKMSAYVMSKNSPRQF